MIQNHLTLKQRSYDVNVLKDIGNLRGMAQLEGKFCNNLILFIRHILSFEINSEKIYGLLTGTPSPASVDIYNRIRRDNRDVAIEFADFCTKCEIKIGDLVDKNKAEDKKIRFLSDGEIYKRYGNNISTGPSSPSSLTQYITKHFKSRRKNYKLIVLIMDSGGVNEYKNVMKKLTKDYENLYIMKMARLGRHHGREFKILCSTHGKLKCIDYKLMPQLISCIKKYGTFNTNRSEVDKIFTKI